MDEEVGLTDGLATYRQQLVQVDQSLETADECMKLELEQLRSDLIQLIELTEESLVSIKKARLLAALESGGSLTFKPVGPSNEGSSSGTDMDREFAAFQAEIAGCQSDNADATNKSRTENFNQNRDDSEARLTNDSDSSDIDDGDEQSFTDLSGTKCRAPFSHSWGELTYHNALVMCHEPDPSEVRVVYCNPTHSSMRPCSYYLDGNCRFDDLHCRFSHGEVVPVEELQPFLEPNYSAVSIGSKCLAHDSSDDIWYRATVVDILPNSRFHVMFDANSVSRELEAQDVLPIHGHDENDGDGELSAEGSVSHRLSAESDTEEEELPVYLWRPGQTTDVIGGWEQHTRGIASRIMNRMGYIMGQGLGKNSEGRSEPVPIQLLPQGKSLDKIMQLKELAGNRDLYDVMKRQQRKQKTVNDAAAKSYAASKSRSSEKVFDFINYKLSAKNQGKAKSLIKNAVGGKSVDVQHISTHELDKKSDKHLNVQLYKTHEEIRNAEREIIRLQMALERNEKSDQLVAKQLREKLSTMTAYVRQLRTSASYIKQNQDARQARNTLSKF